MKKNLLKHMKIIHKITDHEVMVYEERKPKVTKHVINIINEI